MRSAPLLEDDDYDRLHEAGLSVDDALRQLALLAGPARPLRLARPARIGDGIERLAAVEHPALLACHAEAAAAGRLSKFVPASGAATRMFAELLAFQRGPGRELSWAEVCAAAEAGREDAAALTRFMREIERFPFHARLRACLEQEGEDAAGLVRLGVFQPVLDALLGRDGLDLAALPKGLLPFHGYADGPRTAFEEQLVEAAATIRDATGVCRLHFTVAAEQRAAFERRLEEVRPALERRLDVRFSVAFSVQCPSTDTLALDAAGRPARDEQGRLVLRPGGHGALLVNLAASGGDLVLIKNIDNVQRDERRGDSVLWKKLLAGHLVRLERQIAGYAAALREPLPPPGVVDEALAFVSDTLHVERGPDTPATCQAVRAFVVQQLKRPLRVCGVVAETGEPGGGPFWVRGPEGTSRLQIVERAQIDPDDADQQRLLRAATHFNPVDIACTLRDAQGRPFELPDFVDAGSALVTHKPTAGGELRVLERPGLWNGAMAGWNTIFVDVPLDSFTPVKSVLDLLRPAHQP